MTMIISVLPQINSIRARLAALYELTKPGITFTVLMTLSAGFFLARPESFQWRTLFPHVFLGTAFVSASAGILNMLLESQSDALMTRTKYRPIPSGRISAVTAFFIGIFLGSLGVVHLSLMVGIKCGLIAAISLVLYLALYTPMKMHSLWCMAIGAVSGALPPLIGWTAVRQEVNTVALVIFAHLFLWQFPHLLALSWMYKEDYQKAGLKTYFDRDADGTKTATTSLVFTIILLFVTLWPVTVGWVTITSLVLSLGMNIFLLKAAILFYRSRTIERARKLFFATLFYLPMIYLNWVIFSKG